MFAKMLLHKYMDGAYLTVFGPPGVRLRTLEPKSSTLPQRECNAGLLIVVFVIVIVLLLLLNFSRYTLL